MASYLFLSQDQETNFSVLPRELREIILALMYHTELHIPEHKSEPESPNWELRKYNTTFPICNVSSVAALNTDLFVGQKSGHVSFWKIKAAEPVDLCTNVWVKKAHRTCVTCVRFYATKKQEIDTIVFSSSLDGEVISWSSSDGKKLLTFPHPDEVLEMLPNSKGTFLTLTRTTARIWNLLTGELVAIHNFGVVEAAGLYTVGELNGPPETNDEPYSYSGYWATKDGQIRLWHANNLQTGCQQVLLEGEDRGRAADVSPDGSLLCTEWTIWDLQNTQILSHFGGEGAPLSLLISPWKYKMAIASEVGLTVWDFETKCFSDPLTSGSSTRCTRIEWNDNFIFGVFDDGKLCYWNDDCLNMNAVSPPPGPEAAETWEALDWEQTWEDWA